MFDLLVPSLSLDSFSYPAMMEEQLSNEIDECIAYMKNKHGYSVTRAEFDECLKEFNFDYDELPRYCQRQFDCEFNIY